MMMPDNSIGCFAWMDLFLFQRAFLPFSDDGKYFVRNPAGRVVGYIYVIEFFHMGFYIAGSHAFCIHEKYFFLP